MKRPPALASGWLSWGALIGVGGCSFAALDAEAPSPDAAALPVLDAALTADVAPLREDDAAASAEDGAPTPDRDAAPAVDASLPPISDAAPAVDAVDAADAADAAVDPCAVEGPPCDRALYERARDYAAVNPLRDGGTWYLWCGSLMWRFGMLPEAAARPSAIAAWADSRVESQDPAAAPQGAFHWWDIGQDGHVGVDLLGAGHTVFMATRHLREAWGDAIGVTSVAAYTAETGAEYLGWSMDFAGARLADGGAAACAPRRGAGVAPVPDGCPVPQSATEQTGEPDLAFWMRLQRYAALHAYRGPVDGVMSLAAWAGVQRGLRAEGYEGPDDGVPGPFTYRAMQRVAARYGYAGPIDGVLGPNSYRGFAAFLNREIE